MPSSSQKVIDTAESPARESQTRKKPNAQSHTNTTLASGWRRRQLDRRPGTESACKLCRFVEHYLEPSHDLEKSSHSTYGERSCRPFSGAVVLGVTVGQHTLRRSQRVLGAGVPEEKAFCRASCRELREVRSLYPPTSRGLGRPGIRRRPSPHIRTRLIV